MTGVEILASNEIVTAYKFNWIVYFIAIFIITISLTVFALLTMDFNFESAIIGLITGIIFSVILGLVPATNTTPSEYETQYKVTISDEVSVNDFLEKYEIISQEGKIYTVRERDGDTK